MIRVVDRNVSVLTAALLVPETLKVIVESCVMTDVTTLSIPEVEVDAAADVELAPDPARARLW